MKEFVITFLAAMCITALFNGLNQGNGSAQPDFTTQPSTPSQNVQPGSNVTGTPSTHAPGSG